MSGCLRTRSKLRLPEGGVRTDKLASEIAKAINGSRYYGLESSTYILQSDLHPLQTIEGKVLTFQATDFNRFTRVVSLCHRIESRVKWEL